MITQNEIEAAARDYFNVRRLGYDPRDLGADRNGNIFLGSWYLGCVEFESWYEPDNIRFGQLSVQGEMFLGNGSVTS